MFDFSNGTLYIGNTNIGSVKPLTMTSEDCFVDVEPVLWNPNAEAEFTASSFNINMNLFNKMFTSPTNMSFTAERQQPILIQARWHKKARIRKKWLKRYGMKIDTVTVEYDVKNLEVHMDSDLERVDGGYVATFPSCDFDMTNPRYKLRPDQMRLGIKIEGLV